MGPSQDYDVTVSMIYDALRQAKKTQAATTPGLHARQIALVVTALEDAYLRAKAHEVIP